MKHIVAIILMLASTQAIAHENRYESKEQGNKLLGAIAGGYLGSTIGAGDGKTAATVIGAVLGFRFGDKVLGNEHSPPPPPRYTPPPVMYRQADIYNVCKRENPYHQDSRFFESYQRGCIQRESERLRYYEKLIEQQGYKGYNNHEIYQQEYRSDK